MTEPVNKQLQTSMLKPMRLKLLIDTKGKKVLFAEAGKDFVDFLFQLQALPLGKVISLLKDQKTGGSLAKLLESLHGLGDSYIESTKNKDMFLKPAGNYTAPLLSLALAASSPRKMYACWCFRYYYDDPAVYCPNCKCRRRFAGDNMVNLGRADEGGVVKGLVKYMVTDDLVVSPLSTISSITLLNKFNVKDVGALEEKVVEFGVNEAVKLLNATLQSKQVLTDVFFKSIQIKTEPK